MVEYTLLSDEIVKQIDGYLKNKSLHPSILSIFYAILSINNVHPTSQTQLLNMIDAYHWLIRAINEISTYNKSFNTLIITTDVDDSTDE